MSRLFLLVACIVTLKVTFACVDNDGCRHYQRNSVFYCALSWVKKDCPRLCNLCSVCEDSEISSTCSYYKNRGLCKKNSYIKLICKKTCGMCGNPSCMDEISSARCVFHKTIGNCKTNSWIQKNCKHTCRLCGTTPTSRATTTTKVTRPTTGQRKTTVKASTSTTTTLKPTATKPTGRPNTAPPGSCGISSVASGRVIAGEDSKQGQWPWQVAMQKYGRFFCGGSLIAPEWVLTAAHCVQQTSESSLKIVAGDLHRSKSSGIEQTAKVKLIISHAQYQKPTPLNHDIALIKLSNAFKLNNNVHTVCLPKQGGHVAVGSQCYISGWGKVSHPGSSTNMLQHAALRIISKTECKQKNSFYTPITDQMLCAANKGARQSGCHGDSGGPFVCKDKNGVWTVHGAVSWGSPQCDIRDANTVFARVAALRNWIDAQMKKYKDL